MPQNEFLLILFLINLSTCIRNENKIANKNRIKVTLKTNKTKKNRYI